ncbi:MAG: cold shock domain-containing protein [Actinobacteria bacterium]|nr:cold shock domain-containing protein [Actinomycetota bacterium]
MTPAVAPLRFAHVSATVVAFDDAAGWGTLRTDDGVDVFFHCTHIADGTRTICLGAVVEADVAPIGLGTWEATEVRQISPA